MTNLLERINREIEREAERKGVFFPGNESVTIKLELNDEVINQFNDLDLNDNYSFEIEGNTAIITYSEPDEVFNFLSELKGKQITLIDLTNELQNIISYDILDHTPESELIENSSVSVTSNDQEYNIIFEIIEADNDDLLNSNLEILEIEYI